MLNRSIKQLEIEIRDYEIMKRHVRRCIPQEACGILLGRLFESTVAVSEVAIAANTSRSSNAFSVDPQELYRILVGGESKRLEMVGVFHSHPMSSYPSSLDLRYMKLNPVIWVIFSYSSFDVADASAYQWLKDRIHKVEIKVE